MRGRIRTFKPELFFDEKLWQAVTKHPKLHLLQAFEGLWSHADRESRFEWLPGELRARILPYWAGDFGECLSALESFGLIVRYEVAGRQLGLVVNLGKHQSFNAREPQSELPEPPEDALHMRARAGICDTMRAPVEGKGKEGKGSGKEGEGKGASSTRAPKWKRVPLDWDPKPEHREQAKAFGWKDERFARAETRFRNHEFKTARSDADAAFTNWLLEDEERRPTRLNGNGAPQSGPWKTQRQETNELIQSEWEAAKAREAAAEREVT